MKFSSIKKSKLECRKREVLKSLNTCPEVRLEGLNSRLDISSLLDIFTSFLKFQIFLDCHEVLIRFILQK